MWTSQKVILIYFLTKKLRYSILFTHVTVVFCSHSWRNFQSIDIKEIFCWWFFLLLSTWFVYVFFSLSPSVNSIYVKWRRGKKYHCSLSIESAYCCRWRTHANFYFCVMRNERHKSGFWREKKLFRKRNFSSGWELLEFNIAGFPALSPCAPKLIFSFLKKCKNMRN